MKQKPPNMKHFILTNMKVKVYSWPLTLRKVVRQQILGEVTISSVEPFWI